MKKIIIAMALSVVSLSSYASITKFFTSSENHLTENVAEYIDNNSKRSGTTSLTPFHSDISIFNEERNLLLNSNCLYNVVIYIQSPRHFSKNYYIKHNILCKNDKDSFSYEFTMKDDMVKNKFLYLSGEMHGSVGKFMDIFYIPELNKFAVNTFTSVNFNKDEIIDLLKTPDINNQTKMMLNALKVKLKNNEEINKSSYN